MLLSSVKSAGAWLGLVKESLLHLAFPHVCKGCGSDILDIENEICLRCISALPETNFHLHPDNPMEKLFWGRIPLHGAAALYYFTKESLMQHLVHQLKYRSQKQLGIYMGKLAGHALTRRFNDIDALIPLPLFPSKERKRGYNQSRLLCEGISMVLEKPVLDKVVIRTTHTESQTKKNRIERWQNMEGKFELKDAAGIAGKHVLLIDDVVTTGATLEACARELLKAENVQLSIATLCFSSH
jgi:ComF family protein